MYNILVVEDERPLRETWVEGLNHDGLAAVGFEKADEALAEAEARIGTDEAFDLAVVDLQLRTSPEPYSSDRWALTDELKRKVPELLVLLVSGVFRADHDRIVGLHKAERFLVKEKADGFLAKGAVSSSLLAAEIRAILRTRSPTESESGSPAPSLPTFLFEHIGLIGQDRVFAYDSARRVVMDPSGVKMPTRILRSSDYWVLELFLRRPNEILRYDDLPAGVVPGPRPGKFAGGDAKPLTEAVSRIGGVLNPSLADPPIDVDAKFFTNHPGIGYLFNANVRVSTAG